MTDFDDFNDEIEDRPLDPVEVKARDFLKEFFENNKERVFFSRQLEIHSEGTYFHWITNRAVRDLEGEGIINSEWRKLDIGTPIKLIWHKSYRFYRRSAKQIIDLVNEYSNPTISASLGLHGEMMVLEGFARSHFLMRGRNIKEFAGTIWNESEHNLDFIFERDGIAYGIEVKNTLGYMPYEEFKIKIRLCKKLGIRPVFVVRMIPKTWISDLNKAGGFALIIKYQLYPWTHQQLAKKVAKELGLPVDSPRAIQEGTMQRFLRWHKKHM